VRRRLICLAALSLLSVTFAQALDSSIMVRSSLTPAELWNKIGDFCGMTAWDPAVERCDLSSDGKQRTVRFFGLVSGVTGTLEDWDDSNRTFSWTANSPGPVSNYHARIRVLADGRSSALNLTADYDAKGVSDSEARKTIDDAFHRGLCLSSPFLCSEDQRPVPAGEVVEFAGLSPTSRRLTLRGYLRRPDRTAPSPAVVLLHGCGGFPEALDQGWGARISDWGYVTLTVDSFGPRGVKNTCARSNAAMETALDPYQALKFLVQQPFVDPKRVVVLGFSQGGWLSLSSVERGPIENMAENKFVAAAAFYPACRSVKGPMTAPSLIMIGESDDWTLADSCRKLANGEDELGMSREKGEGFPIRLIVYPNAYHGFDLPNLEVPVDYFGHHLEYNRAATAQAGEALRYFLQLIVKASR
jgi:dienelactone hydrolase